jgi:chromosome segregation ATPase
MKSNLAAIILILACLGLGFVLWEQHQKNAAQTEDLDHTVSSFSNNVIIFSNKLDQQILAKTALESNLAALQRKAADDLAAANAAVSNTAARLRDSQAAANFSSSRVTNLEEQLAKQVLARSIFETNLAAVRSKANSDLAAADAALADATNNLEKAQREAKAAAAAAAAATAEAAEKTKRIAELEAQNADLEKQSSLLRDNLTNLDAQMQAAQKKLDANEGDKNLLLSELKRVQAQKEEMENKLSDLAFLKEHVRTLRDNLAMDRRADWIRQGLYEGLSKKGGEQLINPQLPGSPATNTPLDVELHQGGGVKVNSSASANTNAPAARAPSTNAPAARAPSTNALPARAPSSRQAPEVGL